MSDNVAENIIEVKNVKKIYRMGKEIICAVDDVSFNIKKGEFCCLYGTSGSGKSTLLNLMAGIEKLSSGQIIIKGKNVHKMGEKGLAKFRQNNLGFVFQSYNLMNSMTALENVELPLIFKHVPPKKRKKMAKDMLVKVGLGPRLKHKPKEMSGGQQQRVGIARAFVSNPEIVFADEPTGNLDSKTSKEVMDLIKEMAKANHQTIVMVTHDRRLAEYADKIIHIFDGKVEEIEVIKGTALPENDALDQGEAEVNSTETSDTEAEAISAVNMIQEDITPLNKG
jgi:putative ABC transport system ATP-binding protein